MQPGDYLRPFDVPSTIEDRLKGDECVGQPLVVTFYLKDGSDDDVRLLSGFRDLHEQFLELGVNVVAVGLEDLASHKTFAEKLNLKLPLLSDQELKLSRDFGVLKQGMIDGKPVLQLQRNTFFFDASLRVVKAYENPPVEGHAQQVLEDARAWLHREEPRDIVQHAPVLLIPNVFSPELCKELMRIWESGNEESGFMKQVDGKTVRAMDYNHKIRRDHFLSATDGAAEEAVKKCVADRVVPEIRKAFNYAVTRRRRIFASPVTTHRAADISGHTAITPPAAPRMATLRCRCCSMRNMTEGI